MVALYQRLYAYRQRADRSPLEDFLTEALADLLNRMPNEIAQTVVAAILQSSIGAWAQLTPHWTEESSVHWSTQRVITSGRRIDLLLEIDQVPMLVIENKVGAGFQDQADQPDADATPCLGQLAAYGVWIGEQTNTSWGGAVALLTHWTPPPSDFAGSPSNYGCAHTATIRWAELSRLLNRLSKASAAHSGSNWIPFAHELCAFLKEQNMDSDLATSSDIAALQIYIAAADRVRNTVEQIWERAKEVWNPIARKPLFPIEVSTKYGCVWKFRYLARADLTTSFVAAGIRYPFLAQHPAYHDSEGEPFFFVELGSDDDHSPIDRLELPSIWECYDDQRVAVLPLRELPIDPEGNANEAAVWALARFREAAPLLK